MTLPSGSSTVAQPSIALRAELRDDVPWVATPHPRLSWVVASEQPDWVQAHAELRCGGDHAKVDGPDSVLVAWPFAALAPGERRTVAVRAVATDGRTTDWSEPLDLASAVTDWYARPIALANPDTVARPVLLRTSFDGTGVTRAVLHYAALGVTEMRLNSEPVDDVVLAPGWTSYQHRITYETADVTDLLTAGENVLGASLAGGWYTEAYHVLTKPKRFYGDQPRLIAQLELTHDDGTRTVLATGHAATWRAVADPAILSSGIYDGEHVDAGAALVDWQRPGFDDSTWPAATVTDEPVHAEPRAAPPPSGVSRPSRCSRCSRGRTGRSSTSA